jgi:ribose/xylose/arabinose/galactoside ABC-type transport system permease subunit
MKVQGLGWRRWMGSHESALVLVLVGLSGFFTWQNPSFLSWGNLADLINSHCFLALLAVGVFVVLVTGGIDISFTATAAVAQYVTMVVVVRLGRERLDGVVDGVIDWGGVGLAERGVDPGAEACRASSSRWRR